MIMNDENKNTCPECGSEDVTLMNSNRKFFTAGGAGVGGVAGFFARQAGVRAGMMLGATMGSAVPVVGTALGSVIGGIAGAVAGMCTGAAVGSVVGKKIDEMVSIYRCRQCGHTFEV